MGDSVSTDNTGNETVARGRRPGFRFWKVLFIGLFLGGSVLSWMLLREFRENRLIQKAERLYEGVKSMDELTLSQISEQAHHTTAAELLASPSGLDDRFVVLDGYVSKEQSMEISANMANEIFTDQNYTSYVLDDQLVFIDITGESSQLGEGDHVQGHGKVFVLKVAELFSLPVLGEDLQREFGDSLSEDDEVVFFLSKGVELLEPAQLEVADSSPESAGKR